MRQLRFRQAEQAENNGKGKRFGSQKRHPSAQPTIAA
jgi:hypothetical protein